MEKQKPRDPFIGHHLFSKYKIIKKLGQGSFGMIYQGESSDNKIAIKLERHRPNRSSLLKTEAERMNYRKIRIKYF